MFKLRGGSRVLDPQPLTMLQGIDLYDRARLEREGVTSLAGLVYADLVDLMIQTRIPTARLVDWLDQAVLLVYVAEDWKRNEPVAPRILDARGAATPRGSVSRSAQVAQPRSGAETVRLP